MATTSRVLSAAVSGTVYTANLNGALEALDTCHSGTSAPTDDLSNGKFWLDTNTTPAILKQYNNAAWSIIDDPNVFVISASGVDVTGNMTISGTVDGRDVATDGATLDGLSGAVLASQFTDLTSVEAIDQGLSTTDSPTFDVVNAGDMNITGPTPNLVLTDDDVANEWTKLFNASGTTYLDMRNGSDNGVLRIRGLGGGVVDEFVRVTSSGRVGVGTASPQSELHVVGNVEATSFEGDGSALTGITSGGRVLLSTLTASASATLEFTATDATKYMGYEFVFTDLVNASAAVYLYMRMSSDGGVTYDSGASDYDYNGIYANSTGFSRLTGISKAQIDLSAQALYTAYGDKGRYSGVLTAFSPDAATYTRFYNHFNYYTNSGLNMGHKAGYRNSTAAIDAFQFFFSTGNITSGKIYVYGLVK
jgi:hypothetical protein